MTSIELLNRIRKQLDEVGIEGYWLDSEIYSALTDAQKEIVNLGIEYYKAKKELPEIIRGMLSAREDTSVPDAANPLPDTFLYLISAKVAYPTGGVYRPAKILTFNEMLEKDLSNPYSSYTTFEPCVYLQQGFLYNFPIGISQDQLYYYIPKPVDIISIVNPVISIQGENALINYAVYLMLKADKGDKTAVSELMNIASSYLTKYKDDLISIGLLEVKNDSTRS